MGRPVGFRKGVSVLAAGGAAAFWVTNLAISLTPVAATYRAALSISYLPMLLEALVGGLVIGWCVGATLLRAADAVPGRSSVAKALVLSAVTLVVVTLVVEVPAKFGASATSDPWRWFLIGLLFNLLRISALGVAVGLLRDGLRRRGDTSTAGAPRSRRPRQTQEEP